MKDNKMLEALSDVSPEFLEEAKQPQKKNSTAVWLKAGAVAAAFVIAGTVWFYAASQHKDPAVTASDDGPSSVQTDDATETLPDSGENKGEIPAVPVIWSEKPYAGGEEESGENEVSLGPNVSVQGSLCETLEQAGDGDLIAFAVLFLSDEPIDPESYPEEVRSASEAFMRAENRIGNLENEGLIEEWLSEGMSRPEALARLEQTEAYRFAKEEALKSNEAYSITLQNFQYSRNREQDELMVSYGFGKLCDACGERGHAFFFLSGCRAVYCGTKSQIMSLAEGYPEEYGRLILRGVPENYADISFADFYLVSDTTLLDGEKMTEELKAAFENGDPVLCRVYWNTPWDNNSVMEKREREEAAARAIGLSGMAELEATGDVEMYQRFLEALRNLQSHSKEISEIASGIFLEGELQETREYSGCFIALLTEERAAQVAESEDIGFLHVEATGQGESIVDVVEE
ncbi:MAG: hypothetical protein J5933_07345 [Clostridia bacterium]|nr:hypothetical protein [Clostridia bacterium]